MAGKFAVRWIIGILLAVVVAVAAYFIVRESGDLSTSESEATQPAPAANVQPIPASNSVSASENVAEPAASAEKSTPQVSETGDDSESVEEAAAASAPPSLKLASAMNEPKSPPSQFKQGVHYQRLVQAQPTTVSPGKVEVLEIFWYGCPHCFTVDSKLESWRQKSKANYVVFHRVPVPATWNAAAGPHARAYYVADAVGKLDELHTQIFREIHLNGNGLNTLDKVKAFFTGHGVSAAAFDSAVTSFAVESKVQTAALLNSRYRPQGVPFFVVNGKYTLDATSAGGEDQLLQLLSELAAREHRN